MKILVVGVGKDPEVREIESKLETMQGIVGGMIEEVALENEHPALLICNEEGKINGLLLNRSVPEIEDVIAGDFFLCGEGDEDFDSLSDETIEFYKEYFALNGPNTMRYR